MTPAGFTLTILPVMLALFVGVMLMPALNIVRIDARGLGHERALPWRQKVSTLARDLVAALSLVGRMRWRLDRLSQHRYCAPLLVALACLVGSPAAAAPVVFGTTLTEGRHAGEFIVGLRADGGSRENVTVLSGQTLKAGAVIGRVKYGVGRVSIPSVTAADGGAAAGDGTASLVFAGPEVQVGSYVLSCTAAASHGGVFSLTNPSGKALPVFTMTGGSGATTAYTSREINFSITDGSNDFAVGDKFTFVVSTTAPTVIGGTGTGTISALTLGPDAKPGRYQVICRAAVSNGGDFEGIGPDGNSIGRFLMGTSSAGSATYTNRQLTFTLTDATDFIAGNYFDVAVFNQLNGGKVVAWDPTTFDGRHKAVGVLYDAVDASGGDLAGAIVARDAVVLKDALEWGAAITSAQKESAYADLAKVGIIAR